ncbi:thermonuclease family protein [Candidatus Saccharibacteria bacterium]|nr:thermonuclease family protein [Candidatus Saccharibacteria bacterium]
MTKRRRKTKNTLIIGLISLLIAAAQQHGWLQLITKQAEQSQPGLYTVVNFVDGDTIAVDMDGVTEKVRLIGVDTPETHDPRKTVQCFGQAASSYTRQLIGNNKVRLEADSTNTNRDRYQRLLRYVYLPDGRLVNAEIIKNGYGFAYTYFPFTKLEDFKTYQTQAKDAQLGLWSNCDIENDFN